MGIISPSSLTPSTSRVRELTQCFHVECKKALPSLSCWGVEEEVPANAQSMRERGRTFSAVGGWVSGGKWGRVECVYLLIWC